MTSAVHPPKPAVGSGTEIDRPVAESTAVGLERMIDEILDRRRAVGLAVGVVRNGSFEFFRGHGLADIASNVPITEDTVFRIGSITKLFTAIAVMQLVEEGRVDFDAPANIDAALSQVETRVLSGPGRRVGLEPEPVTAAR